MTSSVERLIYGMFGDSDIPINYITFRAAAVDSIDLSGTIYQAFAGWTDDGHLLIGFRAEGEDWTYDEDTSITNSLADSHEVVSLSFDSDGYLHICYGMHGDGLIYRKSNYPVDDPSYNGTALDSMLGGTPETVVSYPTFFRDPSDDTLFFMFRYGASGNGDTYFYEYDTGTGTWSEATGTGTDGLLINGQISSVSAYPNGRPVFDSSGNMHFSWCWRESDTPADTNKNILYTKWNGTTFEQSDGSTQTVPITEANAEVATTIAISSGLLNNGGMTVDADDNPHIVYINSDGSGYAQLYHLYFDGLTWQTPLKITNTTTPGFPDAGRTLRRPAVACDTALNNIYVFYTDDELNLKCLRSGAGNFNKWFQTTIASLLGYAEPQLDSFQWDQGAAVMLLPGNVELEDSFPWMMTIGTSETGSIEYEDGFTILVLDPDDDVKFENGFTYAYSEPAKTFPDTSNNWCMSENVQAVRDASTGRIMFSGYYPVTAGDQIGTKQISVIHSSDHFSSSNIAKSPFYDVTTGAYPVASDDTLEVVDAWSSGVFPSFLNYNGSKVFLLVSGSNAVYIFDPDGTPDSNFSTLSVSQHSAVSMSVDDDNVYTGGLGYPGGGPVGGYLDYPHVCKWTKAGVLVDTFQVGASAYNASAQAVRSDNAGNLYILVAPDGLAKYDIFGVEDYTISAARGTGEGQFWFAYDLVTDGTYIYIIDEGRKAIIKRLCSDGSYIAEVIMSVSATPRSIHYYDGYLYVPHWYGIAIYDAEDLSLVAAPEFPDLNEPWYQKGSLKYDGAYWWMIDQASSPINKITKFTITL